MSRTMRNFVVHTAYAFTAFLMAAAAGLPQPAAAQEQTATLEEVIVTAQRREESLQDVPIAITVLSGAEMERRQVQNILDLTAAVPNITIAQNTGTPSAPRIYIRGIGEDESRATVEPAISLYIDGVYIGRQIGSMIDLFDVERVEVLRGPQGTLYGRNSNGGAIRVITRKPTFDETFLTFKNTFGGDNRIDAQVGGNFSNSPDLAVSFSVLTKTRDGLFRTTAGGGLGATEVGEWDNLAGRLGVRWQAGDDTEMLLRYDATVDNTDPRPPNAHTVDDDDAFRLSGGANTDRYESEVNSRGLSLTVDHDLGDGLSLKSLTAWRSLTDDLHTVIGAAYDQETDQSQISQEFQISSDWDGGFNFVAGLFWFDEDIDLEYLFFGLNFDLEVETRAWAVFGQGHWDIIRDQLWVTAGVRYTDEEKDFDGRNLTRPSFARSETREWDNTSFKVALNYQLRDNIMSYASYATGFKSGAWSPDGFSATAAFLPVDDETVETLEVGLRSDWMDNRLRLNATYFFNTYEDLQFGGTTALGFTRFNVPEGEISGIELELSATPLPGLNISLGVSWLDAEYTDMDLAGAEGVSGRIFRNEVNDEVVKQVDADMTTYDAAAIVMQIATDTTPEMGAQMGVEFGSLSKEIRDFIIANPDAADQLTELERLAALEDNPRNSPVTAAIETAKINLGRADDLHVEPGSRIGPDIIRDAENNDLKNAPESTLKLSVSYTYPLMDDIDLEITGDYVYEDESHTLIANTPHAQRDETDLFNMRVGLRSEQWEVFLWGKNLTDEIYHPAGVAGGGGQVYFADPRTYGLDFKLNFGR